MYGERDTVIFGGGAQKGFAYLGALPVLQAHGPWRTVAGTSIGALAALALAAQLPMPQVIAAARRFEEHRKHFTLAAVPHGLLSTGGLRQLVTASLRTKYRTEITLQQLHRVTGVRLVVTAMCVRDAQMHYFDHVTAPTLPVADAVCASMALPYLFEPHVCHGLHYVDGGFHSVVPHQVCDPARQVVLYFRSSHASAQQTSGSPQAVSAALMRILGKYVEHAQAHHIALNIDSSLSDLPNMLLGQRNNADLQTMIGAYIQQGQAAAIQAMPLPARACSGPPPAT